MLINWISQYLSRILLKLKKYGRTGDQKGGREDNFEQSHLPAASPGGISSVFLDSFSVISRRHLFCLLAIRRMSRRSFFNLSSRCCVYRIFAVSLASEMKSPPRLPLLSSCIAVATLRTRIPSAPFCCWYRPSSLMSRHSLVPHLLLAPHFSPRASLLILCLSSTESSCFHVVFRVFRL